MKDKIVAIALVIIGVFMIFMTLNSFYERLELELHGEITSINKNCIDPSNPLRCITVYNLIEDTSEKQIQYSSGNDISILQDINVSVGDKIEKENWSLSYSVNNRIMNDFPIIPGLLPGTLGLGFLSSGLYMLRRSKSVIRNYFLG